MKNVSVHLRPNASLNDVWDSLEQSGAHILYSEEDCGLKVIHATFEDHFDLKKLESAAICHIAPFTLPNINWVQQFEEHGFNYHDGYVHIDLKEFGCPNPLFNPLKIEPGPGFGDLSHPTTKLVLKMMSRHVPDSQVLDIGSGSGILSLAAVSMGAQDVFGVDICDEAIRHAVSNAQVNNMEGKVRFGKAQDYKPSKSEPLLILMNMIQSEQNLALESLKAIHKVPGDCLISGILKKDKAKYLAFTRTLKWKLISTIEEDSWLGMHFSR